MKKIQKQNNRYKKDFLKSVILKIDFEKISNFDSTKFDNLLEDYPQKKTEQKIEFLTTLSKEAQSIDSKTFNIYRYSNDSVGNCFCVSESFCFFELKSHIGYNNLRDQFKKVFEIFKKDFSLDSVKRIGLRYTNEVKTDDLKKCISKPLLSNNDFYNNIKKLSKGTLPVPEKSLCLGRISFKDDDEIITNFMFGNGNENYPAIITNESFLLDYDSFSTNVHKDVVAERLEKLHERVNFLFEKSITDHLRNIMKQS